MVIINPSISCLLQSHLEKNIAQTGTPSSTNPLVLLSNNAEVQGGSSKS